MEMSDVNKVSLPSENLITEKKSCMVWGFKRSEPGLQVRLCFVDEIVTGDMTRLSVNSGWPLPASLHVHPRREENLVSLNSACCSLLRTRGPPEEADYFTSPIERQIIHLCLNVSCFVSKGDTEQRGGAGRPVWRGGAHAWPPSLTWSVQLRKWGGSAATLRYSPGRKEETTHRTNPYVVLRSDCQSLKGPSQNGMRTCLYLRTGCRRPEAVQRNPCERPGGLKISGAACRLRELGFRRSLSPLHTRFTSAAKASVGL